MISLTSKSDKDVEPFLKQAVDSGLCKRGRNLLNHVRYFFGNIDLRGKRVLDVGGGRGLLSFWTAVNGGIAVCLEPEFEGSSEDMQDSFRTLAQSLQISSARAQQLAVTFQDYDTDEKFDLIALANSINHLNERATVNLQHDPAAVSEYASYFRKMLSLLNREGRVIILDCDRYNFFNMLGLKSPFMPTIEWHKHQSPYFWRKLLESAGFKVVGISWSSPNSLGRLGRILLGNRLVAYFLLSHFRLEAVKQVGAQSPEV